MSQSIKRLEKELHAKLFIKKGKQLELTTDGIAIAEIGSRIVQLWETAKDADKRLTKSKSISIGIFDNAALKLGKYFQDSIINGTFKIELTINASGKIFSQLQLGIYDLAICVADKKNPLPKSIIPVKFFTEELIPVSAQKFRMKTSSIPFILYNVESHTREQIDAIFSENEIKPTILPSQLSVPWLEICEALQRPAVISYASYVLSNWRTFDSSLPITLENIAPLNTYLGLVSDN